MRNPLERREALDRRFPAWRALTISQALDAATVEFPDRALVITNERAYSYRDIQSWSRDLGAGLIARGIKAGDHVAVILANFAEYVAVKYAIARIGAVAVSVNYLLLRQEIRYILAQSDSVALITMDRLRNRNYLEDLDSMAPGWASRGGADGLPKLRAVFVYPVEGERRDGITDLEQLAALATAGDRAELARREAAGDPDSRADIIYTSGTTGLPKGVMLSHDMILRAAYSSAYHRAFEDGRRILFALPMYHVFGYVECLVACTFAGGAIIPQVVFDAHHMVDAAERHAASEIVCVPTMTLKILDVVRARGFNCPSLICMFNSGGTSPPSIWQEIRDLLGAQEVLTAYGMTETTASVTCTLPEGPDALLLSSNGRLKLAGVAGDPDRGGLIARYKTVDPATGQDLPPGLPGELVAKGLVVTAGYYNKPEETKAAFDAGGWLHSGDLGIINRDGYLALTGRLKETYRCGGEMVSPKEIEDLLNGHPLVAQALVVGLPDARMGEVGCACIVPAGDVRPDPQELIALCAGRLARFKVPRHVVFMTEREVPLTATGRPQKFRLADIARQRVASALQAAG